MRGLLHALYLMPAIAVVITLFPLAYLLAAVRVCWVIADGLVEQTAKKFNE